MKNKLKNVGVLSFGLCILLGLSPSNASADEGDSFVDVNVLSKEDGKSSVLDVEILDLPIVGDVNVNIPSDPENDDSDALATVEVSSGVVDDLDVSVLEETDTKTSVATVELESSLTDDVTVDVLSDEQTSNSFDGGVIEVNGDDLPLLGETHVGVLDEHVTVGEEGNSDSSGLIQTDLNDGLLEDASVDILAMEKAEGKEKSAVVDVSVDDDGLLDDIGVSVLKREETNSDSKASLASVGLETAVTDDVNVDIASSDRTVNSFDGGLVEVNGDDLPLLGETHVGVLDKHLMADADGNSYSSGLIQTDLNDGLLEDASIGVLVRKMEMAEDEGSVMSSGVSLNVKLPGTDDISANVLTRKRQFEIAIDEAPSVTTPSTDEENGDVAEENASVNEEESDVPAIPESTDNPSSDGNEEGAMSNSNQEMVTPPASEGDSGDGFNGEIEGSLENNSGSDAVVEEPEQESSAGNGISGNVDADSGYRTGELNGTADASSLSETGQSNVMKGLAMNSADSQSSLPRTGGFWDGKRLAFLALGLMAMGVILRKMGKSTWSAA
ncbi:hypothetical protein [Sporosarcina sp. SAFN-015]|uniref:hypothetical protein n=1 Tax=Sporosarcina sp. SAFN-015 TaxID=3387274 RepID=UPI003F80E2ED